LENRYRIDRLLAHGGMGAIYRGFDRNLDIPVAIKENFFQTPQSIRQFEQEARILARLHHPNLPRVIDHFTADGQQYLVMDYIEGTDLWETVKTQKRPLDENQALNYMIQVCDAVSYLHRYDPPIIHRDIKPQNIKITPNGRAMLVDFGIAKIAKDDSRTSTGARGITPGFSPPEQYSGSGTTMASDIYSLGATLYALLTGKKPPDSVSLLVNQSSFEPPDKLNAKLSPQVCQAILHAMQPQPQDRPQSVAVWQQQLQAIVDDTVLHQEGDTDLAPTMLSSSQPDPKKKPFWRRRPWVWVGLAVFFCICLSLVVIGGQQSRSTDRIVFTSDRDGGRQELYVRNPDGAVIRMTNNLSDEDDAVWSPDGSKLAFASERDGNWEIYVLDEQGNVQRMTNHPAEDRDPAWSPDGSTLAFVSDRNDNWDIFVLGAEGLSQMTANPADDRDPVWSPDGAKMAFASDRYDDYEIFVLDEAGALNRMTNNPAEDRNPVWSPNGQVLAFASDREGDWDIFKLGPDGLAQLTDDPADDQGPVWSADSKQLAFASDRDGDWDIYMMNADGSEQSNLTNNRADDFNPAWTP
jgi:Tol biopolymer transport system component/predicted Ser/Thr protein kinase